MRCPSVKCGSSNVEFLPHYWESLPGDSPLKRKYAKPAAGDRRAVAVAAGATVLGLVLAVTGTVVLGLLVLVAGGVGAAVSWRRVEAAEAARGAWQRRQICLACTHLWEP
ncbi:hypothetical protein [Actinacidiphila yeochonensis]|uniref:hypothetical protein n=1 Tax=Actinacidiphila yeochonensis TaxID=89050 RepID=UPI000562551A|nr:hypothetical protein [Actinacidiphila yeochonensis]